MVVEAEEEEIREADMVEIIVSDYVYAASLYYLIASSQTLTPVLR